MPLLPLPSLLYRLVVALATMQHWEMLGPNVDRDVSYVYDFSTNLEPYRKPH